MDNDYKFKAYVTKSAPKSLQLHDVALNVFGTLLKSVDFTPKVGQVSLPKTVNCACKFGAHTSRTQIKFLCS